MKNTILTKQQTVTLLLNAYGFVDRYGELFTTGKKLIDLNGFRINGRSTGMLEFSYDNVTFDNGVVVFETHDADVERFTVVDIVVNLNFLLKKENENS
jgi:hypothetical protein